jgi:class 3 adenylate cyclase
MDSNYKPYSYIASFTRIDDILSTPQGNFEEIDELPDRDRLTFTNGFYANCSALFVDIRESSKLPSFYRRPVLAKIYRAYISETVAILNSGDKTREVNIVGDGVWAVFNTPYRSDINDVFRLACMINMLMKVLNYKLAKAGYTRGIRAGIGASYGRALMIKAGYQGSGINDIVYMGDVVNHAAKLAAKGNVGYSSPIFLGNVFVRNLDEHNSGLVRRDFYNDCFTSNAVNSAMSDWYDENCR